MSRTAAMGFDFEATPPRDHGIISPSDQKNLIPPINPPKHHHQFSFQLEHHPPQHPYKQLPCNSNYRGPRFFRYFVYAKIQPPTE